MTIDQCARELANLLQSGQPPSAHQVSALIRACLRETGAQQMDLKRHQPAVAFYSAENIAGRSLIAPRRGEIAPHSPATLLRAARSATIHAPQAEPRPRELQCYHAARYRWTLWENDHALPKLDQCHSATRRDVRDPTGLVVKR
jgi:hypothetical protein